MNRLHSLIRSSGPVTFLAVLMLLGLAWLSACRLLLYVVYHTQLQDVKAPWQMFMIGLRMDSMVLCYLLLTPAVLLCILPGRERRFSLVCALIAVIAAFVVYMEVATLPYLAQYDSRPNRSFFEYLIYPREVAATLLRNYKLVMAAGTAFFLLLAFGVWRLSKLLLVWLHDWTYPRRLVVLPLILLVLGFGARSGLGPRPAGIGLAAFSDNHLANEIALDSSYSLLYAVYNLQQETDASKLYGHMSWVEAVNRVRHYTGLPANAFSYPKIPTLHRQASSGTRHGRQPNLVIFMQESLGAEYVGSLGGLPLTPNLDRLGKEGLLLTQLFATGTRTVRGLEAVVCGFPPTPIPGVIKLDAAQDNFFTIARLLKQQGYDTEFIYGGESDFDNMGGFFRRNGFDRVVDQADFSNPVFVGAWGVSDEDLVVRANEEFRKNGDRPFFALMLSTSNHTPFDFPAGRITPHEQPLNTRYNATKYADYAIGRFIELAKREDYYKDTIFLIVADHDTRVFGPELVPVERFHIPALIVGPGVPRKRLDLLSSQIDLLPTLLGLMGIESEHPMIGRDLLALSVNDPGRSIMQYGLVNAFRVGDKLAVHQPGMDAQTFHYRDGELIPAEHDRVLERDALAHLVWASVTYNKGLYRGVDGNPLVAGSGQADTQSVPTRTRAEASRPLPKAVLQQ